MRFQHLTCLFLLMACEDVSNNRRMVTNQTPQTASTEVTITSGIHREQGRSLISYGDEIEADGEPPQGRPIPDSLLDDEGADGKNSTFARRPTNECGLGRLLSLEQKISDCAEKNGDQAAWLGRFKGSSAEADWKLVSVTGTGATASEVWIDLRTRMLWSDIISTSANWCQAAGNDQPASDLVSIACNELMGNDRVCTNYSHPELPNARWRLPSRIDYLQADIDGIRFVLKTGTDSFWTATTSSFTITGKRENAWTYSMQTGNLLAVKMSEGRHVRCIGTSNF